MSGASDRRRYGKQRQVTSEDLEMVLRSMALHLAKLEPLLRNEKLTQIKSMVAEGEYSLEKYEQIKAYLNQYLR
jgi:hypothetical protein